MKNEQNPGKMVFKDHYNSLSDKKKGKVRNTIIERSGMSYTTFYYKLRYNTFRPLELKLINDVLKTHKTEF